MRGNGKVFISHAHADNILCQPLLAALDAWGVDYWFDTQQLEPGQNLSDRLQQAIRDRDIFIRICTANTPQSYWMTLELSAFRSLQLGDQQQTRRSRRVTVNLVLDPRFVPGPADTADYVVAAFRQPQVQTMAQLRAILELPQARKAGVSRRAAIGLGAAGVVTLGALGSAGVLLVEKERATTPPPYPKPQVVAFTNPQTLDPRIRWYFKAGDDEAPTIALAGGVLYLGSFDGLFALKPGDGSVLWTNPRVSTGNDGVPIVAGELLYLGDALGNLFALSARDGSPVWSNQDGNLSTGRQFTIAGNVLYKLTVDGNIVAYNAATGAKLWTGGSVGKTTLENLGPTVAQGTIYVGGPTGLFWALSAVDGSTRWTFKTGGEIDARPVVANGLVYFGSNDQTLYALNASTGAPIWHYNGDAAISVAPVIAGRTAYIGIGTNVHALDAGGGKQMWTAPAGTLDASGQVENPFDSITGQPVIMGNALYVLRGATLYAIDLATHGITWRFTAPTSSGFSSAMLLGSDGVIYFASDNHTLYALRAS
jgi:outer membrane protein assembly factor BamB